jgi:hypothetical protein
MLLLLLVAKLHLFVRLIKLYANNGSIITENKLSIHLEFNSKAIRRRNLLRTIKHSGGFQNK